MKHAVHKVTAIHRDNGLTVLWKFIFKPLASLLVFVLNALGHWLPVPWQGRFLFLLHQLQPSLPNLLAIAALGLIIRYTPQKWFQWLPCGFRRLCFYVLMIPVGLA